MACTLELDSILAWAVDWRDIRGSTTVRTTESGKMIGRKESEWGQMGVRMIPGMDGIVSAPPAANEYAVEPVGVAIMIPSACDALHV